MDTIAGMKDRFGAELRRRKYVVATFSKVVDSFGYEPIQISLIERAEAYAEEVVGLSPWPEWNRKGCFFFSIEDYAASYDEQPALVQAVLVPEGTLSITRWLGAQLGPTQTHQPLPLRIYYEQQCFRNELTSSVSGAKGREFSQFGVEILGASGPIADVEPIVLANQMLASLAPGILRVMFRVSSNRLFLALAQASSLSPTDRVIAKEHLDTIAECKAGKKPERFQKASHELELLVSRSAASGSLPSVWDFIVHRLPGPITTADFQALSPIDPDEISYLQQISQAMNDNGVHCEVDYCVVRSHEYYTGLTFEIDLIGKSTRYVEVGGGGRYDRLLGNFVPAGGPKVVPSTGFAFGVERLLSALDTEIDLSSPKHLAITYDLSPSGNIRAVDLDHGLSPYEQVSSYIKKTNVLHNERLTKRVSVNIT